MEIQYHNHVGQVLQRSVVMHNGRTCRRIARWVDRMGELLKEAPEHPIWQERQNDGEYHNVSPACAERYENAFITTLIRANGLDKR